MSIITTLSNAEIANRKAMTLNSQAVRKTVPVRDIDIVNDKTIRYQGKLVEMTPEAFKGLMRLIGMSQAFAKKFETLFNAETKAKFINQMKNAMAANLNEITMVVSPVKRNIVGFTKKATDMISHERFMDLSDRLIDQHGFEITNWGVNAATGEVTINAFNPKAEFNTGISNEVFTAGLTMKNSPFGGIQVMPYVNRMWCTNGLTTSLAQDSYQLHDLSPESMENFFQHMAELRRNGFVPTNFSETINRAMQTPASLWELERGTNLIKNFMGERSENIIPLEENQKAYSQIGIQTADLNRAQKQNARSNQSIWSLVNGVTWVASHAQDVMAMNMTDADSTKLMVDAGNILGANWNLSNEMPSPFAAKLSADDQRAAWLN